MEQEKYIKYIANKYYDLFFEQGYATAGHNGPHGHLDTPVRNTAHYLIIYTFLFKTTNDERYLQIGRKFLHYLLTMQSQSASGAIKCMGTDKFDHLNGLIGQAWVIEALIYYYECFHDNVALECAYQLYKTQKYDYEKHLWHRIELDGTDIGIDPTYNHSVWFAACSYKLSALTGDAEIDKEITDFLTLGSNRDFNTYSNGILKHSVNVENKQSKISKLKKLIKIVATPVAFINPKKLELRYMENAYHIFDMYGFSMLEEPYNELPLFHSEKYRKAKQAALDIELFINNNIYKKPKFNVYGFSYNCPAFEYPYVALMAGVEAENGSKVFYELCSELMYSNEENEFVRNNPDIETWNARTYEIIRFLDKKNGDSDKT